MVNGSHSHRADQIYVTFPDPQGIRRFLFLSLRIAAIAALLASIRIVPLHISGMWARALTTGAEEPNSPTAEFLLYLDAVRRDPSAWHAVCLVANGLLAGLVLRLGVSSGWVGNLLGALGVGLFGAVMGEWAMGQVGLVMPVEISLTSVLATLAAGILSLGLGQAISRM